MKAVACSLSRGIKEMEKYYDVIGEFPLRKKITKQKTKKILTDFTFGRITFIFLQAFKTRGLIK